MAHDGRGRSRVPRSLSRRSLLAVSGVSVLALAACGEESGGRQFAGDPRTSEPGESLVPQIGLPESLGSPTAIATAMATRDLLTPRGQATVGLVPLRHELVAISSESGQGQTIWSDDERAIWAAEIDAMSSVVAVLTSDAASAVDWSVGFIPVDGGDIIDIRLGNASGSEHHPDAVVGGRGGIAWLPDSGSVVVSMPTGGLLQVYPDGSQVRLAPASRAKRPAAVALSADGNAIAFVEQPSGSDGSGIYAGSMRAKPIDPIVVLAPDRSGNRYARGVQWIGTSGRLATIIDRDELGSPQGDLFFLGPQERTPQLAWTSPPGRDTASVESFTVSPDGIVTAFVTNPVRVEAGKASSIWVMQTDGPSIERFDLPLILADPRLAFAPDGLLVTGETGRNGDQEGLAAGFLLTENGQVSLLYQQVPEATPVASPIASPVATPRASPIASPASPSPEAATSGQ